MSEKVKIRTAVYDVVVVGGGLSGMCAAIAAARHGSRTALIHARHVFGGNASSEIRMHVCGASENMAKPEFEEGGILYEMMLNNKSRNDYFSYSIWDMVLFSAIKKEKNLTAYLNTVMEDCETDNDYVRKIVAYQQTTETRYIIEGNIFIDCTGNGTLGYLAGAEFRTGSESRAEFGEAHAPEKANNNRMGNTLFFKAVDRGAPTNFKRPYFAKTFTEEQLKYRPHIAQKEQNHADIDEDYLRVTSFSSSIIDFGYWWIELSGKEDIINEYEEIRDDLVACVYGVWDHLKNGGEHGAENYDLEWVGMLPGTRESRRLIGDYIINENDVLSNRQFDDAVAYGGWPIDIHTAHGIYDFDKLPTKTVSFDGAYTIPYRSYYSKNIKNLMMAGRIISASKLAFASSRVMGTCAIGGQAVGTAAALCKKYACIPRDICNHINELQQQLLKDDCYIPNIINSDENDLARLAIISASSFQNGFEPENIVNGVSRQIGNTNNMWKSKGVSSHGEKIIIKLKECKRVSQVRITFDSNLYCSIRITPSKKRQALQRIGVPMELVKDYKIALYNNDKLVDETEIKDNVQRLNVIDFDPVEINKVEITIVSTNGDKDARIFEVRVY